MSNSSLDALRIDILGHVARASGAGLDTLMAFRDAGAGLNEAKAALADAGKGAFGKWCDENFNFSKEWRARLMRLANEWAMVREAMAWATTPAGAKFRKADTVLGRKEYSVDGALALVEQWAAFLATLDPAEVEPITDRFPGLAEKVGKANEKAEQRRAEKEAGGEGGEGGGKQSEAERLRAALAEALERIKALEAEVNTLRGGAKSKDKDKDKAKPGGEGPKVDAATRGRARKVAEMVLRPGAYGEALSGWDRLGAMAVKAGMEARDFILACGLDYDAIVASVAKAQAEKDAADNGIAA